MSTTTAINGWTIPELSDVPNIETAIHPLANAIDARVIPIFTTTGARDSAITSPSFGQHAAVSGTGEVYWYNGSNWVSAVPRSFYKSANEQVVSSTTMQNDDTFTFSVEANALYFVELFIVMSSADATGNPDFKSQWTVPASTTGIRWRSGLTTGATADTTDKEQIDTIAGGSSQLGVLPSSTRTFFVERISVDTAGTSGTMTLQWAQNNSDTDAVIVEAGSYMRVWKVG